MVEQPTDAPSVPALPAIGSYQSSPRLSAQRSSSRDKGVMMLDQLHSAVSCPSMEPGLSSSPEVDELPRRQGQGSKERRISKEARTSQVVTVTRRNSVGQSSGAGRRHSQQASSSIRQASKDSIRSQRRTSGSGVSRPRRGSQQREQQIDLLAAREDVQPLQGLVVKGMLPNPENPDSEAHFEALWKAASSGDLALDEAIDLNSEGLSDISDVE